MPGLSGELALKITPDRRTFVVYRRKIPWLVSALVGYQRNFGELTPDDLKGMSDVVIRRDLGVQLALEDTEYGTSTITGDADAGWLSGDIPSGFLAVNTVRSYPEVSGSTSGSSLAATAGPMHRRQQGASEDLADTGEKFRLDADQTAFPGPVVNGIAMDRVFKAAETGNDLIGHEYVWKVEITAHNRGGVYPIMAGYFPGPTNFWEGVWRGRGEYCIVGFNNGECYLYERGYETSYDEEGVPTEATEPTWYRWGIFKAAVTGEQAARAAIWTMRVFVVPPWAPKQLIHIRWGGQNDARPNAIGSLGLLKPQTDPSLLALGGGHIFNIQKKGSGATAPVNTEVRMDMPRWPSGAFAVKKPGWAVDGFFRDRQIYFPLPSQGIEIRLEVYGDFPTGTACVIKLFTSAGLEIAAAAAGLFGGGYFAEFPQGTESTFYPEIHLTGPGTTTPTVTKLVSYRDGAIDLDPAYDPTEIELKPKNKGAAVSIMTGGADPLADSFSWAHVDLMGELEDIENLGLFPFTIETEFTGYDPEDPEARRCILGGGICEEKPRTRRAKVTKAGIKQTGADHPHPIAYEYNFTGLPITWLGSTQRALQPGFQFDKETGQPQKASVAIETLLNFGGWPSSMIDIPDSPIRLFPTDEFALEVDFNADLMQLAVEIAKVYFGATLHFDWNSGADGKWKLLEIPSAPYTNKACFTTALQNSGEESAPRLFGLVSYDETDFGSYNAPTVPILGLIIKDKGPKANYIEVIGGVDDDSGQVVRQTWINTNSFKVHPDQEVTAEDKLHPDWLGFQLPVWKRNVAISKASDLNWTMARLEQQLGHGYKLFHIEAPLLLIAHEDDATRRRPLRFADPVRVVDGSKTYQCIVRSCNPNYVKDSRQMAIYELETVRDVAIPESEA